MTAEGSDRLSPLVRTAVLLVGFMLLVVVGVITVLVPALEDDPGEQESDVAPAETIPTPPENRD